VRVHSLTLFGTPKSMWFDSRVFLLAHNLATPCFGREHKAKVATIIFFRTKNKKGGEMNLFSSSHFYQHVEALLVRAFLKLQTFEVFMDFAFLKL
jgi:hypothetical protein